MTRPRRCVIPQYAHHVRHRGVRKDAVFHDETDRLVYLRDLKNGCGQHGVRIRSYTLMTNHVHLIAVPDSETSISRALHLAHTEYSAYFNAKYGFVGHVWQSRPGISAMDDRYMWNAIRYVERNPVRAGMVKRAEDYPWSSAAAHCGLRYDPLLSDDFPPPGVIDDWSKWLEIKDSDEEIRMIRRHTSTGRPWCTPEILIELEKLTGKKLKLQSRGRPRKEEKGSDPSGPFFEEAETAKENVDNEEAKYGGGKPWP
jgi:putative transposase